MPHFSAFVFFFLKTALCWFVVRKLQMSWMLLQSIIFLDVLLHLFLVLKSLKAEISLLKPLIWHFLSHLWHHDTDMSELFNRLSNNNSWGWFVSFASMLASRPSAASQSREWDFSVSQLLFCSFPAESVRTDIFLLCTKAAKLLTILLCFLDLFVCRAAAWREQEAAASAASAALFNSIQESLKALVTQFCYAVQQKQKMQYCKFFVALYRKVGYLVGVPNFADFPFLI